MRLKLAIVGLVAALASVFTAAPPASADTHAWLWAVFSSHAAGPILYTGCDCIPDTLTGPRDHLLWDTQEASFSYVYVKPGLDLWCRFSDPLTGSQTYRRVLSGTGWHAAGSFLNADAGCEYRNQ